MRVIKLFIILSTLMWTFISYANDIKDGVVQISDQRAVYYQHVKAKAGKPTIVLLNGWIYPIKNWETYVNELAAKGYGVVLVAYSTQTESLRYVKTTPHYEDLKSVPLGQIHKGIETKDLADDVMSVVDKLGIDKFHMQTLSYGSIVGSFIANNFANRVRSVTLITPAVVPSNRYTPYGESRHLYYVWLNEVNKNSFIIPDDWYDLEIYQSLRLVMEFQKKKMDLNGVSFERFLNGAFQMGRSTKYFDLKDEATQSWPNVNVILASQEEPMLLKDQFRFWDIKEKSSPESRLVLMEDVPHAIPGAQPFLLAELTDQLLSKTISPGEHKMSSVTGALDNSEPARNILKSCGFYLSKNNSILGASTSTLGTKSSN